MPNSIKADIGDLVYNGPKKTALDETSNFAPPLGDLFTLPEVEHPMIRHLGYEIAADVP